MSALTVQGRCSKCGQPKLAVEGTNQCLQCDIGPSAPVGPVSKYCDPGEDKLREVLAGRGVVVKKTDVLHIPEITPGKFEPLSLKDCITQALSILGSAPMPKDIKQFKSIQKAIKTLEGLVEK